MCRVQSIDFKKLFKFSVLKYMMDARQFRNIELNKLPESWKYFDSFDSPCNKTVNNVDFTNRFPA